MGNIKKVAVLFTGIVGSTTYNQVHGDQAGRLMRDRHYSVSSEIIHEFRGNIIKRLADSAMAYFLYPEDALKSAIKLQQKYYDYNKIRPTSDQIHIRISIHCGYVIMEENDIYGDVVDATARLALLADSDQIYVSHDVYVSINDLKIVQFDLVDVSKRKEVLNGITVYSAIWDETMRLEPAMTTILCIKPEWECASEIFKEMWRTLTTINNDLWRDKAEHWTVLDDNSVVLVVKSEDKVVDLAWSITSYLKDSINQKNAQSLLPIYIAIDSGAYLRGEKVVLQDLKIPWENMEIGSIYISPRAYHILKEHSPSLHDLVRDVDWTQSFLKIAMYYCEEEKICLCSSTMMPLYRATILSVIIVGVKNTL